MNNRITTILLLVVIALSGCQALPKKSQAQPKKEQPPVNMAQSEAKAEAPEPAVEPPADAVEAINVAPPQPEFPSPPRLSSEESQLKDRVLLLMQKQQWSDALDAVNQLLVSEPKYQAMHINKAIVLRAQGNLKTAISTLENCIKKQCKDPRAANLLGILYREDGQFQQALQAYQMAIAWEPNYATAHKNLAILAELYLFDFTLAKAHLVRFQQLSPLLSPQEQEASQRWLADLDQRLGE
ncbi:MAG: hypothetical protein CMF25_01785 [Kangiellaceae bacterium]|nr:hypothetical protein [Kangiellaceae bacterium]